MSELLKSGKFGVHNNTKEEIIENWENSGLLQGITDERIKEKTALVLDDGAKILLNTVDYSPYSGYFNTAIFPIIRRVISGIDKGEYSHIIKGNYEEIKFALIDLITADFIIKKASKLYEPSLEFFGKIYDEEKAVDIEAEACSFVAQRVTQMYLSEFRRLKIMKGDNGYFTIPEPLN
jgi:hypothetical protein